MGATIDTHPAAVTGIDPSGFAALLDELRQQVVERDDPELQLRLGQLLSPSREYDEARSALEAALRGFTSAGRPCRAALAAAALGSLYGEYQGNLVAARGWFARAWRLLEDQEPCVEQGWVAVGVVGCGVANPDELLAHADLALDRARRFGDLALEAKALADGGLALVGLGRVADGMARLDEAMTMVDSGAVAPMTAGQVCCSLFTACQRSGDLARAEGWGTVMRKHGLIGPVGPGVLLGSHCDAALGTLWCELGRWEEAEQALERGARSAIDHQLAHGIRIECVVPLADLRIRQGRLREAEQLLVGLDDYLPAVIPLARLHLVRGDHELAAAVARRGLRQLGPDRARGVGLLGVLVEAEVCAGRLVPADAAATRMEELAGGVELSTLAAQAALARARVRAAAGDVGGALATLDAALVILADAGAPLLEAAVHVELARLLADDDPRAARLEAQAAAAIHRRMDTPVGPGASEVLARLGVPVPLPGAGEGSGPAPSRADRRRATLARVGEYWSVHHGSATVRLRDTKGLRYLSDLVAHPGVERHVLDLVDLTEGLPAPGTVDRRRLGDAGPLLDARAKQAYRRRLEELREQMEEAEALENDERAYAIQAEIDAVVAELSRAVGLGGRDRPAAAAAERARLNVTRALRSAIGRIQEAEPHAGDELDRAVRTGLFCAYQPAPDARVVWSAG